MDIDKILPMKPVLVEHVSDDISTLQKDDVTKQKTLLTARALEDIFKCAPIKTTNATDVGYFVGGKVDLDKIVTACSRTITADQYIHGPELKFDKLEGTEADRANWSINHKTQVLTPHAFIYTFSVLDDSALSWAHYDGSISIDDSKDASGYRKVDARAKSPKIRQIYVPNVPNEYYPNRPSDALNPKYRSRQDLGTAWTRYGYLKADGTYQWERWFKMGATHNGAEYYVQIITSKDQKITTPLYDAVYHVYNEGVEITLPNANLDGYRPGMKIIVEVHPAKVRGSVMPSCRVLYTDTTSRGVDMNTMNIYITPKVRRNTKDIYGNVRDDVQITSVASFELVEVTDTNGNTFRTWELDGGVEESDFVSGLAQMLGEHTDLMTGDLVQYQDASRRALYTIDILHPITSSGFAVARFLKNDALEDANWTATVEIMHPQSDADFSLVDNTTTPVAGYIYYVKTGTTMALAKNEGHPESFIESQVYYALKETCSKTSIIQFVPEGSVEVRTSITLNDLIEAQWRGFNAFMNRNCVLHIRITSNRMTSAYQGIVYPTVYFFPDQHDQYIQKQSINPSAFTWYQLEQLFKNGGVINMDRSALETFDSTLADCPASTRALLDGYTYLARKLQNRGLVFGNCAALKLKSRECDTLVNPGFFYITPEDTPAAVNTYPPGLTAAGCNLMIVGNDHASAGMVHEEEGTIVSQTKVMQIAVLMGTPMQVWTRIGTKKGESVWEWTTWREFLDWEDIHNKPLYFHSRWDYFESPDKLLNRIDNNVVSVIHNETSKHCEVVTFIQKEEIAAIMKESDDPGWDENVNYDIPQYMVGINTLDPSAWISQKTVSETGIDYVVNVRLPDATVSLLTTEEKKRRRKIRFLFYGRPTTDWSQVLFRLSFASYTGGPDYTYERNWGGSATSIIVLEFEQVDLPTGERVWCPHEIG